MSGEKTEGEPTEALFETPVEQYEHALGKLVMRGEIDAETALHALDGYDASLMPLIDELAHGRETDL